jgi:hypothetical protein
MKVMRSLVGLLIALSSVPLLAIGLVILTIAIAILTFADSLQKMGKWFAAS